MGRKRSLIGTLSRTDLMGRGEMAPIVADERGRPASMLWSLSLRGREDCRITVVSETGEHREIPISGFRARLALCSSKVDEVFLVRCVPSNSISSWKAEHDVGVLVMYELIEDLRQGRGDDME